MIFKLPCDATLIDYIISTLCLLIHRWGKETFPGAPKSKATRNGANNMIEDRQNLLATFLSNDRMTKSLAAEYHNYNNHKILELQFGRSKMFDSYKIWLLSQKVLTSAKSDIDLVTELDGVDGNNDDDEDENNINLDKRYKPVGRKFWYSVVNNVIFSDAKAQNCYCSTCLTAKQLFPEYFRLFLQDCRALHSLLQKDMLTDESDANVEDKISQLELRAKDEEAFFTSTGTHVLIFLAQI